MTEEFEEKILEKKIKSLTILQLKPTEIEILDAEWALEERQERINRQRMRAVYKAQGRNFDAEVAVKLVHERVFPSYRSIDSTADDEKATPVKRKYNWGYALVFVAALGALGYCVHSCYSKPEITSPSSVLFER